MASQSALPHPVFFVLPVLYINPGPPATFTSTSHAPETAPPASTSPPQATPAHVSGSPPQPTPHGTATHFVYHIPIQIAGLQPTGNNTTSTQPFVYVFYPEASMFPVEERPRPGASEAAMKRLPITKIVKEHVETGEMCPICVEQFVITPPEGTESQDQPVRQMPCGHIYHEECLFEWLKQSNTCPVCRKEIEAVEVKSSEDSVMPEATPSVSPQQDAVPAPQPQPPTITSCHLADVGCCGETHSHDQDSTGDMPSPIVTLPICHHRFHASCLRTSLLVEGYSLENNDTASVVGFRCPTCRSTATVQSSLLKTTTISGAALQPPIDRTHLPIIDMELD